MKQRKTKRRAIFSLKMVHGPGTQLYLNVNNDSYWFFSIFLLACSAELTPAREAIEATCKALCGFT